MRTIEEAEKHIAELEKRIDDSAVTARRERDAARKERDKLLGVLQELNAALVVRMVSSRPNPKCRAALLAAHDKANEIIKEMRTRNEQ